MMIRVRIKSAHGQKLLKHDKGGGAISNKQHGRYQEINSEIWIMMQMANNEQAIISDR